MFRKVLLCYDGSQEGRRALRAGADVVICMKSDAHLLAICKSLVHSSIPEAVTPALCEREESRAQALLDEGVNWLRERGVNAQGTLEYGNAVDCIAMTVEKTGSDLVVLGHKRRGSLAKWWSASDEESLLERVDCSILVASADD